MACLFALFALFKSKKVVNNNKRIMEFGGNFSEYDYHVGFVESINFLLVNPDKESGPLVG